MEGREVMRGGKHYYRLDGEWVEMKNITPHVIITCALLGVLVAVLVIAVL